MSTPSRLVPRLDSLSTSDANANYLTESRPETIFHLTSTEAQMTEETGNHLGGSKEVRQALVQLVQSAKELQNLLRDDDEAHCFVTCKSSSGLRTSDQKLELFTLSSRLFHKALLSDGLRKGVTIQALRDVFHR